MAFLAVWFRGIFKKKEEGGFIITNIKYHSGVKDVTPLDLKWGEYEPEIRTVTIELTSSGKPNVDELLKGVMEGKFVKVSVIE